jgi:hypothetical protein
MSEHSRPEYHQLVATTVARLNKDTGGACRAVVERARTGLTQVHRAHRSSLLKIVVAELDRMALEDAIKKSRSNVGHARCTQPRRRARKFLKHNQRRAAREAQDRARRKPLVNHGVLPCPHPHHWMPYAVLL